MKKTNLLALVLALSLVGCSNDNTPAPPPAKDATENADTIETNNGKEIEVENDKSKAEEGEAKTDDNPSKESSSDQEGEEDIEIPVAKDQASADKDVSKDLFYLPGHPLIKLNEDGKVADEDGNEKPSQAIAFERYVKYSNNIVVEENPSDFVSSIYRISGPDKTLLYEFEKGQQFHPSGIIGDKIYGLINSSTYDENLGTYTIDYDESGIGLVDLSTGDMNTYSKTLGKGVGDMAVVDGEIRYISEDKDKEGPLAYKLYSLDTSKSFDQDPQIIDEEFGPKNLFSAKYFKDGNPVYEFFIGDGENITVNDKTYPHFHISYGMQDFIGQNLLSLSDTESEEYDPFLKHLKIENFITGELILDEDIRGMKLEEGKLYYISVDNEIKSVDLAL